MAVKNFDEVKEYMNVKKEDKFNNIREEMNEFKKKGYPNIHPEIIKDAIPMWNGLICRLENKEYREAGIILQELTVLMRVLIREMEEMDLFYKRKQK